MERVFQLWFRPQRDWNHLSPCSSVFQVDLDACNLCQNPCHFTLLFMRLDQASDIASPQYVASTFGQCLNIWSSYIQYDRWTIDLTIYQVPYKYFHLEHTLQVSEYPENISSYFETKSRLIVYIFVPWFFVCSFVWLIQMIVRLT